MNFRLLLTFFLTLVVGVASAQQTVTFTPPTHPEDTARYLLIGIETAEGVTAGNAYDLEYSASSEGPFLPAIQAKVRRMPVIPPEGYENAEFLVTVDAFAEMETLDQSYQHGLRVRAKSKGFRFEKVGGEWKLPKEAYDFGLTYPPLFSFYRPDALDYEVRANGNGREGVFSTRLQVNTFTDIGSCSLPSSTQTLRGSGKIQLAREFVVSTDPNRWWTTQEIIIWEKPAPQPRLAISRTNDGKLKLSATGVKYLHLGMLQESSDLLVWASPPQLLKKQSDSDSDFILDTTEGARFYRLRISEDFEDTLSQ